MSDIETINDQMVARGGGDTPILVLFPKQQMTQEQAIRHAAWLVALADPLQESFPVVLKAVMNT